MPAPSQILVFDRAMVRNRRNRAAKSFAAHDALFRETEALLLDRLGDVKRDFKFILDLGAHDGSLAKELARDGKQIVAVDASKGMIGKSRFAVVADEELLPFAPQSFDLIVSNLSLHWVNDLPGTLAQIKNTLKPGGLFLATLLGGDTLHELRACLMEAELAVTGGASPRLSPTIELQTAAALLQRAGFALPVADQETLTLTYADAFALMRDLRGMGEGNSHRQRLRRFTRRPVLSAAAELYRSRFADTAGRISAQFDVVFLHGWKD